MVFDPAYIMTFFAWVTVDLVSDFVQVLTMLFEFAPPFLQGFLIVNWVLIVVLGILRLITG